MCHDVNFEIFKHDIFSHCEELASPKSLDTLALLDSRSGKAMSRSSRALVKKAAAIRRHAILKGCGPQDTQCGFKEETRRRVGPEAPAHGQYRAHAARVFPSFFSYFFSLG